MGYRRRMFGSEREGESDSSCSRYAIYTVHSFIETPWPLYALTISLVAGTYSDGCNWSSRVFLFFPPPYSHKFILSRDYMQASQHDTL